MSDPNVVRVYLIENGGLHKIGVSSNPEQRAGIVRCGDGERTVVHSFACEDYRGVERKLHDFFAGKRVKGEWFDLDPADVSLFCTLRDCVGVEDLPEEIRSAPACERRNWGQTSQAMVRIPADVYESIRQLAKDGGRPVTWEIRRALIAWLESQGRPVPKKGGAK